MSELTCGEVFAGDGDTPNRLCGEPGTLYHFQGFQVVYCDEHAEPLKAAMARTSADRARDLAMGATNDLR